MGGGGGIAAENIDGEGRAKGYAWFRSRSLEVLSGGSFHRDHRYVCKAQLPLKQGTYSSSPSLSLPLPPSLHPSAHHSFVHSHSPFSFPLADILHCNAARLMHTLSLYSNALPSASIRIPEELTRATRHCRAHSTIYLSIHPFPSLSILHPPSSILHPPPSPIQPTKHTDGQTGCNSQPTT